jgi:hypothetical protein
MLFSGELGSDDHGAVANWKEKLGIFDQIWIVAAITKTFAVAPPSAYCLLLFYLSKFKHILIQM